MRGLFIKAIHETLFMIVVLALAIFGVALFLTTLIPELMETLETVLLKMKFFKTLISALLGINVDQGLTAQMLQAILWVHPLLLSMLWIHAIVLCTRFPVGEVDHGTIDVLLGLPVSRRQVIWVECIVWGVSTVALLLFAFGGYQIAAMKIEPAQRPTLGATWVVLGNLLCLQVAVGGLTCLVSSFCERRGRAIGIILALLLWSFLLNFLAQLWPPAEHLKFFGLLEYYRPGQVLGQGAFPTWNVVILLTLGISGWVAGAEITARRNLATV